MIPGVNLLSLALQVITPQQIVLHKWVSRSQNSLGRWVNVYAPGIPVEGSWQPTDTKRYAELGFDVKKDYFTFYTSEPIRSIDRDTGVDVCYRDGRKYETAGETNWQTLDGWQAAYFVDVGPENG